MAGNVKLMTSTGGGVILDTATTTATDVTVKVPVTGVNNGTLVCSDSSGNVGIGTSSPARILDISKSGDSVIGVATTGTATQNNSGVRLASPNKAYLIQTGETDVSSSLRFYDLTAGSERMRIDSSGNLLVGTTSTTVSEKMAVVFPNSGRGIRLENNGTVACDALIFRNPNGTVGAITNSATTTSYVTSSDYRLKENVQPMQNALGVVQQLNPVTYNWKADGSDGQGFIAHELQAVVPDCVTGEKDAVDAEGNPVYQGIDTSFLVATLTKAIQELSAKNDSLEARLAALEAK